MVDFIHVAPIPEAVRAVLRGNSDRLPDHVEIGALVEHGIAPLLYSKTLSPSLKTIAVEAAAIEALRLADLRAVLAALDAASIQPLILKGTALAYSLYPAPELRQRMDTDLLIDRADLSRARDVFIALGLTGSIDSGDELGLRQCSFSRIDSMGAEHTYDVHWDISNHAVFADVLRYPELRERSVELSRIGPSARGLSLVDALLVACIHRVAHHHGSERLIWLYDIQLLLDAMSVEEQERFWKLAAERHVVAVCADSIRAATGKAAAEAGVPHGYEPSSAFLDRRRRRGALLLADVVALSNWRERLRRFTQLAFPPRAFMSAQFKTRSVAALPFLYAFRAVRGVGRLFRRVAE